MRLLAKEGNQKVRMVNRRQAIPERLDRLVPSL
jgi:hypothetical protein